MNGTTERGGVRSREQKRGVWKDDGNEGLIKLAISSKCSLVLQIEFSRSGGV